MEIVESYQDHVISFSDRYGLGTYSWACEVAGSPPVARAGATIAAPGSRTAIVEEVFRAARQAIDDTEARAARSGAPDAHSKGVSWTTFN